MQPSEIIVVEEGDDARPVAVRVPRPANDRRAKPGGLSPAERDAYARFFADWCPRAIVISLKS